MPKINVAVEFGKGCFVLIIFKFLNFLTHMAFRFRPVFFLSDFWTPLYN
jgi:hypothetical protein